jgi:hypothetical protein
MGATSFKEQNVKTTCELPNDRPCIETMRCIWQLKKKDIPTIDEETKIPFFAIIFSSLDVFDMN